MKNKSFKMQFTSPNFFRKGDILTSDIQGKQLIILKAYKNNWFKKLLYIAFGIKPFIGYKVKFYDNGYNGN